MGYIMWKMTDGRKGGTEFGGVEISKHRYADDTVLHPRRTFGDLAQTENGKQ